MLKRRILNLLYDNLFYCAWWSIFYNPLFILRRRLFKGVKNFSPFLGGKLLDFGCGRKPYKKLFNVDEYIGLDIEVSGHPHDKEDIDIFYDGKVIPFENEEFDSIFSTEVFEHVFNLDEVLPEVFRVLKKDGHILVTVPFVWDEHEVPYDFARYSSFGIKHVLEKHGFSIIELKKTTTYVETVFQMLAAYISQVILPRNKFINFLLHQIFVMPVLLIGIIFSWVLPDNKGFYHNSVVLAKK